ncbi:MAG TPA: tetratricopeptide repeat protein [Vicinamibacterales bacterium]|nr:tetratricopeptide repeat protein [Vicinamibacterales bacterium]
MRTKGVVTVGFLIVCFAAAGAAQPSGQGQPPAGQGQGQQQAPAVPGPAGDLLKQGQQKLREGQLTDALELFRRAADAAPEHQQPHLQAGIVLDLLGRYADARQHLSKAIDLARTPQERSRAMRTMAMSYAFERNCAGAEKYEAPLYEEYLKAGDFFMAGEIANELARVCLESGAFDTAEQWYRRGYEAGLKEPAISPARRDLWEFRWAHARARLAARRGNIPEAHRYVQEAKAALDRGTNPEQAPFYPYLTGYVAFYAGDYKTALTELQKANQNDPFILALIAQTYEKLGDQAQAAEYYRRVLRSTVHNPTGAYARPIARQKLEGTK